MTNFERDALIIALAKMFNHAGHFSICDLEACLELAGIKVPRETLAPFRALHCVHYADMPPGFKKQLAEECLRLFDLPPDFVIRVEELYSKTRVVGESPVPESKRSFFRLLGF